MRKRFLAGVLFGLLLCFAATASAAPLIENVSVEMTFSQSGQQVSLPMAERMRASLLVICEHLLRERSVELVTNQRSDYERVIREVAERVLTGYDVEQVSMTVGATTAVRIVVKPWGLTVNQVDVRLKLSGVSEDMLPTLRADLGPLEQEVQALLSGLSQDAVDWSGGAVKQQIRQRVEERLPEFQAAVEISSGEVPVVNIVLLPVGQVIQGIRYQMVSASIPNVLLVEDKETLGRQIQALRGLPVRYAQRRIVTLTQWLTQKAAATHVAGRYRLTPTILFQPAADADVQIQMESDRYRVWAEGRIDLNSQEDNLLGKLHVGKFFSPKDELFAEVSLAPSDVDWTFEPGYARHEGPWSVGVQVATADRDDCWWLERKITNNWRARTQFAPEDNAYEFSLRYRVHEFLSIEYVVDRHEQFVRMVGNL